MDDNLSHRRILLDLLRPYRLRILSAFVALILWVGGHDVLNGAISAGELSAFIFYAVIVASAMGTISEVIGDVQRAAGATGRLVELLETPSGLPPALSPLAFPVPVSGAISFCNVEFAYPSRPDLPVFKQFNLDINRGEKIALVGSELYQQLASLQFQSPDKFQ